MKKSIFLFFAAILCAIGMNAATVTSDGTARLYFNKEAMDWWDADGAKLSAYFYNSSTNKFAGIAKQHSGNTYYVVIPKGSWTNVILTRHNNTTTTPSWDNKWNQTGDLTLSSTSNYISKFENDKTTTTWGTAVKPASDASVSAAASTIFVGASTILTPSLTSNADINDVKSTTYTISPATGASISGNTFTASAEGTYTITATVTYHPDGYSSLTSTATATTTIVAEVPAEEVNDVTVSYMCGSTKVADPTTINTVGVETPVKVTAPEIAKYTFANWTLGADVATTDALTSNEINITTKAGGSDFTLVANYEKAKLTYTVTVPAGTENCYLVGAMNGWDVANPIEMTKQGENVFTTTLEGVATTDEYKYISQKGSWDYEEVGGNRTWTANDVVTAWKDPLATNVHLAGTMTDWDNNKIEFKKATKEATTASIILNLTAGDYKFKIVDNGSWLGNDATINNTISGWTFASDKGDCPLKATIAGDYTFTWAISTKKLSVTYPTICAITATANDAAMGTIAGAGNYGKGSTATLTATPKDGYLFVNWTKGGVEVATTQEYSFTVEEAVELVANFEAAAEEVHNVTVSYVCGGNKIAEDQTVAAVGETTAKTVEAPAVFGYTFSSWTLGAGVTSANELTSNTIDINIVAGGSDYTLTANYTEIPKVTVYFVNNKKWSKVQVYGWKDGEEQGTPGWPGNNITVNKEAEQVAGFDVYSYSVVPGSYDNIIFNNKEGDSGEQTETFKWTDGKYYYVDATKNYAGGTAEEVATALGSIVTYDYYIAEDGKLSGKTDWSSKSIGLTDDDSDGIYEKTFTEQAVGTYLMKVTNGTWDDGNVWGFSDIEGAYEEVKAATSDNNIQITLTVATTFTVKFNSTTKKITFEGLTINTTSLTYRVEVPEGTEKCFIAGPRGVWDFQEMTREGETDIFTITIVGAKETDEYKYACQASWDYKELDKDGNEVANRTWTELDKVEKWGKPAVPTLMGIGGDWTTGIEMTINPDNADEYMLLGQVIASAATVKIKYGDTWCATLEEGSAGTIVKDAMEQDNISLTAGTYDFYYKVTANKVYIKASIAVAIREDLTVGQWGTLCPTQNVENPTGATFYQIAYLEVKDGMPFNMHFNQITATTLTAGQPYFFIASETEIKGVKSGEVKTEGSNVNGFYGYIGETSWTLPYQASFDVESDENTFVIWNNSVFRINAATSIKSERCYININSSEPSRMPAPAPVGARRITMGVSGINGQNTATGVDQVQGDNVPTKMIINGQLFILRGEKMYDAQGKLVK